MPSSAAQCRQTRTWPPCRVNQPGTTTNAYVPHCSIPTLRSTTWCSCGTSRMVHQRHHLRGGTSTAWSCMLNLERLKLLIV
ncbi:unnamed protein product [Trichogramma brassicae]|uniref:Uncharacterized protein n=1 Tax=Trichogramma brassicae TaxID=86971 RepID=A0A6H5J6D0_9HYME|nr:unnamed protein product [Trichogramma brassicae]